MAGYGEKTYSIPWKTWTRKVAEELAPLGRLLALITLAIYLPIMAVVAIAVLATSPGPALVKKAYRRVWKAKEIVYLYEFRTECWLTWRETPVGAYLRQAQLYGLPRLVNVLAGDILAGERLERIGA
jgi:lipopolysaccharide/colanic/teichoic acid biosynthesis glycosyltransferase